ncbi:SDR family NAD(P)-dependent oxidoreductase [Streptomonospora sediminis]
MMSASAHRTAVVIGAGPGLGMSVAHRFGREGYNVVLVSRTAERHPDYIASLAEAGIRADSLPADVHDREALLSALDTAAQRHGGIDAVYYGPAPSGPDAWPTPIDKTGADSVRSAMSWVYPAVDVVEKVLPGMLERGSGALLFATGLGATRPMPELGGLALSSAALRNYALTLNAALAEQGVYAGALIIGGAIERSDIYRMVAAQSGPSTDMPLDPAAIAAMSIDPDTIADAAWQMLTARDRAETTFDAMH